MNQPLFHVVVLHPAAGATPDPRVKALRMAFEPGRMDPDAPPALAEVDPWSFVKFSAYSDPVAFEQAIPTIGKRALFILLVNERMVDDPAWQPVLGILASALPKKAGAGTRDALCFTSSEEAQERLPGRLKERQVPETAVLGERRLRPHTLALLALHRARLVLGVDPNQNKLKLFISHAKHDGLFLAHALRSLILEVPELDKWYDADDIQSGEDWSEKLAEAASHSVFIAIRTEGYEQRKDCRDEFEAALASGVPIVVVDAILSAAITPSSLPFAAMPTVRIPDGNTHRVLLAALREHLRMLLLETLVADQAPGIPKSAWRVWPRLPTLSALRRGAADLKTRAIWLLPQTSLNTAEFSAARDSLAAVQSLLALESVDSFLFLAPTLVPVATPPVAVPLPVIPPVPQTPALAPAASPVTPVIP